jgi:hypothetical protein
MTRGRFEQILQRNVCRAPSPRRRPAFGPRSSPSRPPTTPPCLPVCPHHSRRLADVRLPSQPPGSARTRPPRSRPAAPRLPSPQAPRPRAPGPHRLRWPLTAAPKPSFRCRSAPAWDSASLQGALPPETPGPAGSPPRPVPSGPPPGPPTCGVARRPADLPSSGGAALGRPLPRSATATRCGGAAAAATSAARSAAGARRRTDVQRCDCGQAAWHVSLVSRGVEQLHVAASQKFGI